MRSPIHSLLVAFSALSRIVLFKRKNIADRFYRLRQNHTRPAGIIIFSGYQFHDSLNQQKKPGGISSARQIFEPTIPTLGRR
jgi:hypothetical protein